MKAFDDWNFEKKKIEASEFEGYVRQREIWWCSLGLNVGVEEDGKNVQFERPILVLKKFNRDMILVIPFTNQARFNKNYFSFIYSGTLFTVMLSQLRLISTKRLNRNIRTMELETFITIQEKIIELVFK